MTIQIEIFTFWSIRLLTLYYKTVPGSSYRLGGQNLALIAAMLMKLKYGLLCRKVVILYDGIGYVHETDYNFINGHLTFIYGINGKPYKRHFF